jgi:hypothetical protein
MVVTMNAETTAGGSVVNFISAGSPAEMGMAQGVAIKEKLHAMRDDMLRKAESFRLRQPCWMTFRGFRWLAEFQISRLLTRSLERDFPRMNERLEGIAQGAGLQKKNVLLFNALEPLLSTMGGCTASPGGACSAVAVRGKRTKTGEPMIARNFDYLPLVQPYYIVRESRPKGGLRSLDFTTVPLAGAVDGMNEAGLCITYDYAFTTDTPPCFTAPLSMLIAEALEQCATVGEAAGWITTRPRWGGGLLMMADASGDIASLEISSTRSYLRRPAPGEDALFHSNLLSSDCMREIECPLDTVYTKGAPVALRGQRLHESAERRDRRYAQLLAQKEVFGEEDLAVLMGDHGEDGVPGRCTPCVHSDYWNTTACLQFLPASRRMRVAYEPACCARYAEVRLGGLERDEVTSADSRAHRAINPADALIG